MNTKTKKRKQPEPSTKLPPQADPAVIAFIKVLKDHGMRSPITKLAFGRIAPARQVVLKMQMRKAIENTFQKKKEVVNGLLQEQSTNHEYHK